MGHVLPVKLLAGVLGALLALTGLTVLTGTTYLFGFDLAVAMIIATVKASLVCVIFMHLKWDRGFHAFAFLGSVLFVGVFLAYTLTDTKQYQGDVRAYGSDVSLNSPFASPLPDPHPSTHDHGEEGHSEDEHSEPANGESTEH